VLRRARRTTFAFAILPVLGSLLLGGGVAGAGEPEPQGPALESLVLNDLPLRDVARLLSDRGSWPVTVSVNAGETRVSTYLEDVRTETAVRVICRAYGLWYKRAPDSNVVQIMTLEEFSEGVNVYNDETVEVVTVLYPTVERVGEAIKDVYADRVVWTPPAKTEHDMDRLQRAIARMNTIAGASSRALGIDAGGEGGAISVSSEDYNPYHGSGEQGAVQVPEGRGILADKALDQSTLPRRALEQLDRGTDKGLQRLSKRPALVYASALPYSNALILRSADPEALQQVKDLVRELDKPAPQVLLEVKILDVALDDSHATGVDWLFRQENIAPGPLPPNELNGGFANGIGSARGKLIEGAGSALVPQGTGIDSRAVVFSYVSDQLRARLQMLEQKGTFTRVGTPNLIVADNEASRLFVGRESTLLTGVDVQTVTRGTEDTVQETVYHPETERMQVGTSLVITPRIHADRTVTIRIVQENSQLGPERVIRYGGHDEDMFITRDVEERSVTTTAMAGDGNIVAISGLVEEETSEQDERVPGVHRIPVVGKLFQRKSKSKKRNEMLILIRPFILLGPDEAEQVSIDYLKRISEHPAAQEDLPELGVDVREETGDAEDLAASRKRYGPLLGSAEVKRSDLAAPDDTNPSQLARRVRPGLESRALRRAKTFEKSQQYTKALVAYRDALDRELDQVAHGEARLGVARCLMRLPSPRYRAALNALAPLPENPQTGLERQQMALAGEILLRLRNPQPAESVLEVALSGLEPSRKDIAWLAPTYANLGVTYMHNRKLRHAEQALQTAARHYDTLGMGRASLECQRLVGEIRRAAHDPFADASD
jgi:general secretion pathway protein D